MTVASRHTRSTRGGPDGSGRRTGAAAERALPGLSGSAFRRIWAAAAISNLGDGIGLAALPLLVASLTKDPLLVAGAAAALQLPWLVFALPSGGLVDRTDRRRAMVATDLIRTLLVGCLALFVLAGEADIALICVVSFALSTAETVFDPASEAILPLVVESDSLAGANARLQGTTATLNYFVGPPIGAALFAVLAAAPFALDAASFLASALIVLTLAGSYRPHSERAAQPLLTEVRDGLSWLAHHPVLRYTSSLAGLTNIATYAIVAILVLFAKQVLGLGDLGYGILLSAYGVGAIVGSLTAGMVIAAVHDAGALRISTWMGAAAAVICLGITEPTVFGLAIAAFGFSGALWNVAHVTLRQRLVPDELRGRVAGANRLVTTGAMPVGAALGGVAATAFGLRAPFVLAAILLVAGGIVALARITPAAIAAARADGASREDGSR